MDRIDATEIRGGLAPASAPSPPPSVLGILERVSGAMGELAGWGYLVCAGFITFDVVARRFLGFSSQGTVEISGYLLAFGIAWGLSYALLSRAHIRIDVFVGKLPAGPRAVAHLVAVALLALFGTLLAARAWSVVSESWELGATDTSALYIPLVVPQVPWALGLSVFAIAAIVVLVRASWLLARARLQEVDRLLGARTLEEETEEALEAAGVAAGVEGRPVGPL